MRKKIISLLLCAALALGLAQPAFAAQEKEEAAESIQPESTLPESAQEETVAPIAAQEPEQPQTASTEQESPLRAGQTFSVSAEGRDFLSEMMTFNESQLASAETKVNAFIRKYDLALSQNQFDALLDFEMAYSGDMLASGYQVEKLIAAGGYTDAELASAFCSWVKGSDGTLSHARLERRLREVKLYLYGSYDGNCEAAFRYVAYYANGGTLEKNTVICYPLGQAYGALPTATRDGQYFVGWFSASSGGTQLYGSQTVQENLTVYAHWTKLEPGQLFVDVPPSAWFYDYVTKVVEAGLFNGVSDTAFEPEEPLSRAMLCTVLWRIHGSPAPTTQAPFADVAEGQWFTDAIDWAYETGVVNGVSDTAFEPEENITREDLTTMLYRYAAFAQMDTSGRSELSFPDSSALYDYAVEPMQWAVSRKIINGSDDGRLYPKGEATRAECAKMIAVFRGLSEGTEPSPEPTPDPDPDPQAPVLKMSEAGIQFIKDNEGFAKYPMWDYGQYSVGYGSRCPDDKYEEYKENGITEEEADYLLRLMLADFEQVVDKVLEKSTIEHTQSQYDAIVSLTYNVGQQWINSNYQIYQYILYGGCTELDFVNVLGSWSNAGGSVLSGLCRRRMEEADMYLNGDYALNNAPYRCLIFNGAKGTPSEKTHYYKPGGTLNELPTATREGYTFLGWFDKTVGGTQYTVNSNVPGSAVTVLYAHWEALPGTVEE